MISLVLGAMVKKSASSIARGWRCFRIIYHVVVDAYVPLRLGDAHVGKRKNGDKRLKRINMNLLLGLKVIAVISIDSVVECLLKCKADK